MLTTKLAMINMVRINTKDKSFDGTYVPQKGEIFYNVETSEIKIGDGISSWDTLKALQDFISDDAVITTVYHEPLDEFIPPEWMQKFIENNITLITANRYNELFDKLFPEQQEAFVKVLLKAEIDFYDYVFPVPPTVAEVYNYYKNI